MKLTSKSLATLLFTVAIANASAVLTVQGSDGNGLISGAPGEIVGYDFTFSSSDYAVLNFSEIDFSPAFATYTDYLSSNYIVVAPGQPVSQQFSLVLSSIPGQTVQTGAGQFAIDPLAQLGAFAGGRLTVDYSLYSVDPNSANFDSIADLISAGDELSVDASLQVISGSGTTPTAAPEASTQILLAIALIAAGLLSRRRQLL
jgi:hypothetical protein